MGRSVEWSARSRAQEDFFPLRGAACVAEPDENERRRIAQALRRMGFNVHETGSGATAGFIAAQTRLEVMVLNVSVRDAKALTLIRQMRRAHPDLCIVALTPGPMDAPPIASELARHAGADATLHAPPTAQALARVVAEPRRRGGVMAAATMAVAPSQQGVEA